MRMTASKAERLAKIQRKAVTLALSVPCPKCHVETGFQCREVEVLEFPHTVRYRRARGLQ